MPGPLVEEQSYGDAEGKGGPESGALMAGGRPLSPRSPLSPSSPQTISVKTDEEEQGEGGGGGAEQSPGGSAHPPPMALQQPLSTVAHELAMRTLVQDLAVSSHSGANIMSAEETSPSPSSLSCPTNAFASSMNHSPPPLHDARISKPTASPPPSPSPSLAKKIANNSPKLQSPRSQFVVKDTEKEKITSPKSHSPSLQAPSRPTKDTADQKEKINSPRLQSPKARALTPFKPKDKISKDSHTEKEKGSVAEHTSAEKEGIKRSSPPPLAQGKRPPPLIVKPTENPPLDNKRRIYPIGSKDKEKTQLDKVSHISPVGTVQSPSSKGSPLKLLKTTSPSSSEIAPNATAKTPTKKTGSRFPDQQLIRRSPVAQEKRRSSLDSSAQDVTPSQGKSAQEITPEDDRMHRKVKDFFQRRKSGIASGIRKVGESESVASSEQMSVLSRENKDMGPFLLKLAKQAVASGDSPQKALDYATRAAKSYEAAADGKPCQELVMSLHILAAIHCSVGQFEEAIPVLQHSIEVSDVEGGRPEHALAAFAGNMQLGDTFSLLGRGEDALSAYHCGLEVQKQALGDKDPRIGETCRYLAEAHAQAMQFDKAEKLCQHALDIHKEHSPPASVEEAMDRRLMGLICNGKGQFEAALEHLVLASMSLIANGKDVDVATVDSSIGDTYVCLGRFDEAVFAYQKALTVLKASKGENHVSVASVYVSLAELYLKTGKLRESKTYCESALRIFNKHGGGIQVDEVATGLTELAAVYEALNEQEQALSLLKRALGILEMVPGQQSAVAGVEAQIGVLNYLCGNYVEARSSFNSAILKLRVSAEKTSPLFGIVLNQMGLCCLHLSEVETAAELLEESRSVLEIALGPHHPDTLAVYSNLAGAYDALGRLDEAIGLLQYVLEVREEELGTANPEVDDEKERLAELLKEAGRFRARRLNNTLALLMNSNTKPSFIARPSHTLGIASVPVKG